MWEVVGSGGDDDFSARVSVSPGAADDGDADAVLMLDPGDADRRDLAVAEARGEGDQKPGSRSRAEPGEDFVHFQSPRGRAVEREQLPFDGQGVALTHADRGIVHVGGGEVPAQQDELSGVGDMRNNAAPNQAGWKPPRLQRRAIG